MNGKGESGQIGQVHCFRIEASHEINVFTSLDKRSHLVKTLFIFHKYLKNFARIANAVQVTICLLVSTNVY